MQRYINNVIDRNGAAVSGALVTVTDSTGAVATLYSDDGITTTANPLTTDGNGFFAFYAANGVYTITISGTRLSSITLSGVLLFDDIESEYSPVTSDLYALSNVALTSNTFVGGREVRYSAATGATNLFVLGGYKPVVCDTYVSSGANASGPLFKITSGRYARLLNSVVVNAGAGGGILLIDTDSTGVNRPTISVVDIEDFSTIGLDMRSSVTEARVDSMILQGLLDYVAGLGKPHPGTIGWKQITPVVGSLAVGGHQVSKLNCSDCETGMRLQDAQLSDFDNVSLDSCSGFGLYADGACVGIDFNGIFVGTTRGVYVGGTSVININGLHTLYNGTVPPWAQAGFYTGTAYDITVADTAVLTVNGWRGDKKVNVASTAKLIVLDGTTYIGRSTGTIGTSATGFIAEWGSTATEADALWRAPAAGRLLRICPTVDTAPGLGETFTYTARQNGADTTLVATITGNAFGGSDVWEANGGISVSKGDSIAIKLQTSSAAGVGHHYCELQFIPD